MWVHCESRYDVEIMAANPSVLKYAKATRIITETVKNNMICIIICVLWMGYASLRSDRKKHNMKRVKTMEIE